MDSLSCSAIICGGASNLRQYIRSHRTSIATLSMYAMFDGVLTLRAISVAMLDVRGVPNPGGVC